MDTLLFLFDGVLVAVVCFMALKDSRRPRGTPAIGLFRYKEAADAPAPPRAGPGVRPPGLRA